MIYFTDLERLGIKIKFSVEYTLWQNGVVELANRTVVGMARCMMNGSGLQEPIWGEAIGTAVYIRNRCATTALNGKSPIKAWNGIMPTVAHLKTFRCKDIILDKRPGKSKFGAMASIELTGYCTVLL